MHEKLARTLRGLVRSLTALARDRRGSADLNTYLLLTAAGCVMVGVTAPSLFKSSKTASDTFERQVEILQRGSSGGAGGGSSGGSFGASVNVGGVNVGVSNDGVSFDVSGGRGSVSGTIGSGGTSITGSGGNVSGSVQIGGGGSSGGSSGGATSGSGGGGPPIVSTGNTTVTRGNTRADRITKILEEL